MLEPCLNPALEGQAVGRVHRMGQTREVTVTRLVCKATIEERIVNLLYRNRSAADGGGAATDVKPSTAAPHDQQNDGASMIGHLARDNAKIGPEDCRILFDIRATDSAASVAADAVRLAAAHTALKKRLDQSRAPIDINPPSKPPPPPPVAVKKPRAASEDARDASAAVAGSGLLGSGRLKRAAAVTAAQSLAEKSDDDDDAEDGDDDAHARDLRKLTAKRAKPVAMDKENNSMEAEPAAQPAASAADAAIGKAVSKKWPGAGMYTGQVVAANELKPGSYWVTWEDGSTTSMTAAALGKCLVTN